jgi:NhaA family Na+:H+ antiporter
MLLPAFIYYIVNRSSPDTLSGWAIPVATDIAFTLGVLSLFGRHVPTQLKLFLMSLAIFDDMGAILIIACYYSTHFIFSYLYLALATIGLLFLCQLYQIRQLTYYVLLGGILWYAFLHAGIHPTLAGVILALFIPYEPTPLSVRSALESKLAPWVSLGILPLFAFCNAGVSFSQQEMAHLYTSPIVKGIILGLVIGKQLGVFGTAWLIIKCKFAESVPKISWLSLYGASLLCGIGFTMSLFLGTLSFEGEQTSLAVDVRLGVLVGSSLSAILGATILWFALIKRNEHSDG